jgi:hypothetical protein
VREFLVFSGLPMPGELMIFAAALRSKYYRLMFHTAALWSAPAARCSAISYQQRDPVRLQPEWRERQESKSGTPCCSGKRSIRSPHRMLFAASENSDTKSLRISRHKWIFPKSSGKSRCWTPVGLELKTEESGNSSQLVVN